MQIFKIIVSALIYSAIVCVIFNPAHAYIDPGTGSLIIQGIIGAIAAIGVTLKLYWHKLKIFFIGSKKSKQDNKTQVENKENE